MWQALIRFFFPKRSFVTASQRSEVKKETLRLSEPQNPSTTLDIHEAFVRLVLSIYTFQDTQLSRIEKAALQQIEDLLSAEVFDEKMVPRLPAVVPQLLCSLRSDDVSGKHLAEQIGHDPVLVGEVIRISNSAFYKSSSRINSIERAVVILGRTGLQRLIANVVMKPIFNVHQGHFGQQGGSYLWSQSERCAFACAYLARSRYDPFDAYLAGMICKIGMIVAIRILDHLYKNCELPKSIHFYQTLVLKTKKLSRHIAERWQFPVTVLDALEEQVSMDDQSNPATLGGVLYRANRISELHILVEEKHLEDDIDRLDQQLGGKLSDSDMRCYVELKRMFNSRKS
ncbi:MAG: HDOD domain-containing protein [Candidatus Competibacteraceae bacterium]